MHLIRRATFRAAGAASTSFTSAPRSLTTASSPFLARSKIQSAVSPAVFRRFNSDDARPIESADAQEDSTVRSAIESSSEGGAFSSDAGDRSRNSSYPRERNSYNNSRVGRGALRPLPTRTLPPSNGIYIGNLLFEVTAEDLQREFAQFGTIKSTKLATDSRGLSKGFGYIEFETVDQAQAAIAGKNQTTLEGRTMVVNFMARDTSRTSEPNPPSKTLFIGNLAFEMSDADLNKLFRDIRNVLDVRVAIDRRTGQPRGFAHADFVDVDSAVQGKTQLDGQELYGRQLRVDYSSPKANDRIPRNPRISSEEGSSDNF